VKYILTFENGEKEYFSEAGFAPNRLAQNRLVSFVSFF
jgi:hypothetical protein